MVHDPSGWEEFLVSRDVHFLLLLLLLLAVIYLIYLFTTASGSEEIREKSKKIWREITYFRCCKPSTAGRQDPFSGKSIT